MKLSDFKLTEIIKIRNFFQKLKKEIYAEANAPEFGLSDKDKSKIIIIEENIDFLNSYIIRKFQLLKLETDLPTFHTKESLENMRKEMELVNKEMVG